MRVAAIDCGTNSIRLLIADVPDDGTPGLLDVERQMRVVRLGQGVDATGRFDDAALERTFAALDEYAQLLNHHHVGPAAVRFVATSATRDAENREEFMAGVRARIGVDPEVITGEEEAALSFAGAVSVHPPRAGERVLVVDLGGGSTEFVVGDEDGVTASKSIDMGCVRFTERFLHDDPPTSAQIAAAESTVAEYLAEVQQSVDLTQVDRVIGVAGTITTITAHALDLEKYLPDRINGASLPLGVVGAAATELLELSRERRELLPFMHPGRVDVIGAGALIWRAIVTHVGEVTGSRVSAAITSEHDILDGIALNVAARV
ncbi:Ppx/GppA phosphatase family protein [Zhihengliuella flava]|uniref:Exopolyphosphatase/guanosine-5'-triphosphate, 3'-diphosphate pyrophosphatase n=1 Tax=Zhihengliuella flava TaxID=1285193 RepID=A0A931GE19_9MICC|nr:Ppx/GppA phosphatase family protein [Zhihengliuella flava]MBG6084003.1 exopolyphosphatase/guanosine-5'-triphosphate,3'-diphosphate pyrophosphatase [Zhihengliuella flava]